MSKQSYEHWCWQGDHVCEDCGLDSALWDEYPCNGPTWEDRQPRAPQEARIRRLQEKLSLLLGEASVYYFETRQWRRMRQAERKLARIK